MLKNKDKTPLKIDLNTSTKKVYFGDDGGVVDQPKQMKKIEKSEELNGHSAKKKDKFNKKQNNEEAKQIETKWYQKFDEHNTGELKELSDFENKTLAQICRNAFSELIVKLEKSECDSNSINLNIH